MPRVCVFACGFSKSTFWSLRQEIGPGKTWNALFKASRQEPGGVGRGPAENQQFLRHLVAHHTLHPSQALAVRQCLDEGSVVSAMTGGAGIGKSETLVACIKAVMWQHGHFDPCIADLKKPSAVHTGRKGGWGHPMTTHLGHAS